MAEEEVNNDRLVIMDYLMAEVSVTNDYNDDDDDKNEDEDEDENENQW